LDSDIIYNIHVLIEQNNDGIAILKRQLFSPFKRFFKQQIEPLRNDLGNTFDYAKQQTEIKKYLDELGFEYIGENVFFNFDINKQQKRLIYRRHFKIKEGNFIPVHYKELAT